MSTIDKIISFVYKNHEINKYILTIYMNNVAKNKLYDENNFNDFKSEFYMHILSTQKYWIKYYNKLKKEKKDYQLKYLLFRAISRFSYHYKDIVMLNESVESNTFIHLDDMIGGTIDLDRKKMMEYIDKSNLGLKNVEIFRKYLIEMKSMKEISNYFNMNLQTVRWSIRKVKQWIKENDIYGKIL